MIFETVYCLIGNPIEPDVIVFITSSGFFMHFLKLSTLKITQHRLVLLSITSQYFSPLKLLY
ncbi:MAG: hypothetical protein ACI8Y3_000014 [Paraglaciecola sp.]|jgi:hypothetical protein